DEAESSERNQRDPPRLVPKVHIVSDDEATFDCRGRHQDRDDFDVGQGKAVEDRKSTRLNSSHVSISYAVFCLKKKTSELQSRFDLVCRLLLEKKNKIIFQTFIYLISSHLYFSLTLLIINFYLNHDIFKILIKP